MKKKTKRPVSKRKAAEILRDKTVRGKKLTPKQRKMFGAIASGSPAAPPSSPAPTPPEATPEAS